MPEPPKLAPVDALLAPVEPSVSQYKVPACAGPRNPATASIAKVTTVVVRKSRLQPPVGCAIRFFKSFPVRDAFATEKAGQAPILPHFPPFLRPAHAVHVAGFRCAGDGGYRKNK